MKLKKILALACSLVMASSMFVATANAAVEGCTATLEFAGYEVKGTTTFAKINVKATIPDTLVPYEMIPADWETTFEDSYKGLMLQGVGFDIPNVAGLTYVSSLSSAAEYVQLQDNKAEGKVTVYAANSNSYDTYYAGEVDTLATLTYRITGDVNGTYDVALSDAVIGLVSMNADGTATPKKYTFSDFAVTNATVKPAAPEVKELSIEATEVTNASATNKGYAWKIAGTTGEADLAGFSADFTADGVTKTKNATGLPEIKGGADYEFYVALRLSSVDAIDSASFTVTDAADATATDTWNK